MTCVRVIDASQAFSACLRDRSTDPVGETGRYEQLHENVVCLYGVSSSFVSGLILKQYRVPPSGTRIGSVGCRPLSRRRDRMQLLSVLRTPGARHTPCQEQEESGIFVSNDSYRWSLLLIETRYRGTRTTIRTERVLKMKSIPTEASMNQCEPGMFTTSALHV